MKDIDKLFSQDGMVHTAPPMTKKRYIQNVRRRDPLNSTTYEEAAVCLKCTRDDCDGDRKCFKLRHELMKRRKADSELDAVLEDADSELDAMLEDAESEIDAMISEFNATVKAINKEI